MVDPNQRFRPVNIGDKACAPKVSYTRFKTGYFSGQNRKKADLLSTIGVVGMKK